MATSRFAIYYSAGALSPTVASPAGHFCTETHFQWRRQTRGAGTANNDAESALWLGTIRQHWYKIKTRAASASFWQPLRVAIITYLPSPASAVRKNGTGFPRDSQLLFRSAPMPPTNKITGADGHLGFSAHRDRRYLAADARQRRDNGYFYYAAD